MDPKVFGSDWTQTHSWDSSQITLFQDRILKIRIPNSFFFISLILFSLYGNFQFTQRVLFVFWLSQEAFDLLVNKHAPAHPRHVPRSSPDDSLNSKWSNKSSAEPADSRRPPRPPTSSTRVAPCRSLWRHRPHSQHTNTLPHTSYYHLLWGLGCPGNWWCHNIPALLIISVLVKQSPPVRWCVLMFNFSFCLRVEMNLRHVSALWSDTFGRRGRQVCKRWGDFVASTRRAWTVKNHSVE